MRTLTICAVITALLSGLPAAGQAGSPSGAAKAKRPAPDKRLLYKSCTDAKGHKIDLHLEVFLPKGHRPTHKRPAIVFFFGGGWVGGSTSQFYPHADYLASRGMVAMAAEYRVAKRHGTSPRECVADGKSAVRYLRRHADDLGIDAHRVAAGGGSAGGHVAAATATVTAFDEPGEDSSVSAVPDALVLFNPVYDNGPKGYGHDRVKAYWQKISPLHNLHKGVPPTIVFLGTRDKLIPVTTAKTFQAAMRRLGCRSELMLFEGKGHGFFNYGRGGNVAYTQTVRVMDAFLASLGWLKGKPTLPPLHAAGKK